jgi:hypothetical protein
MGIRWGVFLPPLPQDLPELRRRIIAAILMQLVWAEWIVGLTVCHVAKRGGMQKTIREFLFPSVCRVVTIFSTSQMYRFYEKCHGIMKRPVLGDVIRAVRLMQLHLLCCWTRKRTGRPPRFVLLFQYFGHWPVWKRSLARCSFRLALVNHI